MNAFERVCDPIAKCHKDHPLCQRKKSKKETKKNSVGMAIGRVGLGFGQARALSN